MQLLGVACQQLYENLARRADWTSRSVNVKAAIRRDDVLSRTELRIARGLENKQGSHPGLTPELRGEEPVTKSLSNGTTRRLKRWK
jgi:hypothetical protein